MSTYAKTWKQTSVLSEAVLQNAICGADAGKQQGGQLTDFTGCFLSVSTHITTWGSQYQLTLMVSLACGSNVVVSFFCSWCNPEAHVAHGELHLSFWASYLWLIGLNLQVGDVLRSVSLSLIMRGMTYPQRISFSLKYPISFSKQDSVSSLRSDGDAIWNGCRANWVQESCFFGGGPEFSLLVMPALILAAQGRSQPPWSSSER